MPSRVLFHDEPDRHQEVGDTNAARLGDSCPSFQLLRGHPFEPAQTLCSAARRQVLPYLGGHLVEAKGPHRRTLQYSKRFHVQMLLLQRPWQTWENAKDTSVDRARSSD